MKPVEVDLDLTYHSLILMMCLEAGACPDPGGLVKARMRSCFVMLKGAQ